MNLLEIQDFVHSLKGWVKGKERKAIAKGLKKAFNIKKDKIKLRLIK